MSGDSSGQRHGSQSHGPRTLLRAECQQHPCSCLLESYDVLDGDALHLLILIGSRSAYLLAAMPRVAYRREVAF